MPFLKAGFNYRHRDTGIRGWTRPLRGGHGFAPAQLILFAGGDLAWLNAAERPRFLTWGELCVFGSWPEIDLPEDVREWSLPRCDLVTRAIYLPETGWREAA